MGRTGRLLVTCLLIAAVVTPVRAQEAGEWEPQSGIELLLSDMFSFFLEDRLNLGEGFHASHYFPAAATAQEALAPALSNLISSNVASFPLSATQVGIILDFSTGVPVKVIDRQGPIFAETGQTIGQNRLSAGINYTHLNLTRFRGTDLDELTFSFTHEDFAGVGGEGVVGDQETERDVVIVRPRLELTSGITAIHASYGILDNLEIGIALPIVTVRARGVAEASVESWTLENTGVARHFLGGTAESPVLEASHRYDDSETYLHSIGLRAKYQIPLDGALESALLLDVRFPTGSEDRLLGEGATNWQLGIVGSGTFSPLNPHVNLLYSSRGADYDSDRMTFAVGFDRPLSPGVTVAVDLLGDVALGSDQAIRLYDPDVGPVTQLYLEYPGNPIDVHLSNIDDRDNDSQLHLSGGTRVAFSPQIQALVNLLVPLGTGGLYARWVPTAGLTIIL